MISSCTVLLIKSVKYKDNKMHVDVFKLIDDCC